MKQSMHAKRQAMRLWWTLKKMGTSSRGSALTLNCKYIKYLLVFSTANISAVMFQNCCIHGVCLWERGVCATFVLLFSCVHASIHACVGGWKRGASMCRWEKMFMHGGKDCFVEFLTDFFKFGNCRHESDPEW